jgi:hypothetical protein
MDHPPILDIYQTKLVLAAGEVGQTLEGHSDSVMNVAFSPDNSACHAQVRELNRYVILNSVRILCLLPGYEPGCVASKGSLRMGHSTVQRHILLFVTSISIFIFHFELFIFLLILRC